MKKVLFIGKIAIFVISSLSLVTASIAFCVTFHIGISKSIQQQLSHVPILSAAFTDTNGVNGTATLSTIPAVFPENTTFSKNANILNTLQVGKDSIIAGT